MSTLRRPCAMFAWLMVAWLAANHAAAAPQTKVTPDLTGTWVLNRDLTDRPGQGGGDGSGGGSSRRGPGGGMGRPGGMGGMGGMGGRGGGFGGGGMPDREEMERMRATMEAVMRSPERLIIVKADPGLIVTDEEGVSTRLALDGSKETGAVNGVTFESITKWEDGKLRVERKFKSGLKLVETYALSMDPHLLTVSARVEGGRMGGASRTTNRVYEPRDAAPLLPLVPEAH